MSAQINERQKAVMAALQSLAERCERANRCCTDTDLIVSVCAVFGIELRYYPRAGWKRIYDNGRPGSVINPLMSLDDFSIMARCRGPLPEMIHSDPRLATAAALRALAEQGGE